MPPLVQIQRRLVPAVYRYTTVISLLDGRSTTVHVTRYNRKHITPRVVTFDHGTYLSDWCNDTGVREAVTGGFFLRAAGKLLGETWIDGVKQPYVPFVEPYSAIRGSLYVRPEGNFHLGPRSQFPARPEGDLLQAGPLLVRSGHSLISEHADLEGFSVASHQFDSDITIGRYPRTAIGSNERYIWSVVVDGRSDRDAGVTLAELADILLALGAETALNLDGGGSATQICGGKLRNYPRGDDWEYERGRPIYSAIVFESKPR